MKKAVVVDKNYGSVTLAELDELQKKLAQQNIELALCHCTGEDEIIACARDAEIILGTGNPPITARVMESLPGLKAVLRFGIGVNSVDLEAATRLGKVVLFMPGFCVNELAVHATGLALALNRNIAYYDRGIRRGEWPKGKYYTPRSPEKLTLGLYGFGASARELYKIWHFGFGSRVITHDPYVPEEARSRYEAEFVDFDTMLRESDILSIHAPLTAETRHIINMDAFRKMKNDAILINIARGPLVDQEDLVAALEQGEIRFAGLDVYETEPLPADSPLRERDDVVLTCHSAYYGEDSKIRQLEWAYEFTLNALNKATLSGRHIANPDVIGRLQGYTVL